jgi:hypothetical protein
MAFAANYRRTITALAAILSTSSLVWFGNGLNPLWPLLWFAPLPILLLALSSSWRRTAVTRDGNFVAYWIGGENVAHSVPGSGAVYIVPVGAGPPHRIAPSLSAARFPIWSPDSKRILFVGNSSNKAFDNSALDSWVAPIDGGPEIRTGEHDALVRAGLEKTDYTTTRPPDPGFPLYGRSIDLAVSSAIKTERPSAASSGLRRRTAWRMRQVPKLFLYGRRYGRDLRSS